MILKLNIKRQDKSKNSPLIEMSYDFNFFFSPFVEIFHTFAPKIKSNPFKSKNNDPRIIVLGDTDMCSVPDICGNASEMDWQEE